MTCFELVKALIHRDASVQREACPYGKFRVTLTEAQCPASIATVCGLPEDSIVIRLDDNLDLNKIFQDSRHECRRCDFIIVARIEDAVVIVYIEMKHGRGDNSHIRDQLRGARCFVDYMQSLGKAFALHETFLKDAKHRFVAIIGPGPQKGKTSVRAMKADHNSPDSPLFLTSPRQVAFAYIAGGN